jgi:hypothetical protein
VQLALDASPATGALLAQARQGVSGDKSAETREPDGTNPEADHEAVAADSQVPAPPGLLHRFGDQLAALLPDERLKCGRGCCCAERD